MLRRDSRCEGVYRQYPKTRHRNRQTSNGARDTPFPRVGSTRRSIRIGRDRNPRVLRKAPPDKTAIRRNGRQPSQVPTGSASNVRSGPSVVSNIKVAQVRPPTRITARQADPSPVISRRACAPTRTGARNLARMCRRPVISSRAARRQDKAQRTDNVPCATRPPNINRRAAIRST